jgi:hypothetical protein
MQRNDVDQEHQEQKKKNSNNPRRGGSQFFFICIGFNKHDDTNANPPERKIKIYFCWDQSPGGVIASDLS